MFIRTEFNYDMNLAGDESGLRCMDGSLAKQSFAEEVDINTIVRRFGLSGELPVGVRMPTYGDFTGVSDFRSAMDAVVAARESFDTLPAHVRTRFHNDPAEFVDFCSDDDNIAEARKLGLVPKEELVVAPVAPAAPLPLRDAEGQFRAPTAAEKAASTVST